MLPGRASPARPPAPATGARRDPRHFATGHDIAAAAASPRSEGERAGPTSMTRSTATGCSSPSAAGRPKQEGETRDVRFVNGGVARAVLTLQRLATHLGAAVAARVARPKRGIPP